MARPVVGIIMGSDSDIPVMNEAALALKDLKIPFEMTISSAHRTPARTEKYVTTAEKRGIKVIIAGAGMAAHLAGVAASHTTLPVIGVPIDSGPLNGLDALLSTVQMPSGMPVATVAIGKAGARNAGILAAQILGTSSAPIRTRLKNFKKKMARVVEAKAKKLAAGK
jgi:phosphoribosylaminoimidazole carboxylase PurE protein